jgi:pectin methylesterase-like acyl-CoA thioesterase
VADADLAGYAVYRSIGSGASTKLATVSGTSFTDSSATVGTTYRYTVVAVDTSANESAASSAVSATPVKADVIVAADGSGDALTVQDGINKLADNADYTTQGGRVVLIQPGTYTGTVTSGNRYGVTLVGATGNAKDTVLTAPGGAVATFTISGRNWTARNLTIAGVAAATGGQATAVQVKSGDQQFFDNVRFLGDKQTLLLSTSGYTTSGRVYIRNSYIEGGADIIQGRATTVIENSTIHVLSRASASITDSSVSSTIPYGILITGSTITTDGLGVYLGRPYPDNASAKAQVVVRQSTLDAGINTAQPWKDWDATTTWTTGRFFEYQNSGAGAAITNAANRPQLSDADAATYTVAGYLAGWNPTGQ